MTVHFVCTSLGIVLNYMKIQAPACLLFGELQAD